MNRAAHLRVPSSTRVSPSNSSRSSSDNNSDASSSGSSSSSSDDGDTSSRSSDRTSSFSGFSDTPVKCTQKTTKRDILSVGV